MFDLTKRSNVNTDLGLLENTVFSLNLATPAINSKYFRLFIAVVFTTVSVAAGTSNSYASSVLPEKNEQTRSLSGKRTQSYPNFEPPRGGAIVHLFNYPFQKITESLQEVKDLGFDYIQIAPPQLSRGDREWFGRYQPLDYRIIDGRLGNLKDLKQLISEARKLDIGIIADVVLNHTANLGKFYNLDYPPKWVRDKYGVSPLFNSSHFHSPFCIQDYDDRYQVLNGRLCDLSNPNDGGLPDLDLDNEYVVSVHRDYLYNLKALGIAGFRIDAVKHMEVRYFRKILDKDLTDGLLIFGEVIADKYKYDQDLRPYLEGTNMKLMDFPYQKSFVDAFRYGSDIRILLARDDSKRKIPEERAILFVINHDIPNNGQTFSHLLMSRDDERLAHMFMFARKGGIPHIYSDLGKRDLLSSNRWVNYHSKPFIKDGLEFYNATFNEPQKVIYADRCAIAIKRGQRALATLNKCNKDVKIFLKSTIEVNLTDRVHGIRIFSGNISKGTNLKIPRRSVQYFLP